MWKVSKFGKIPKAWKCRRSSVALVAVTTATCGTSCGKPDGFPFPRRDIMKYAVYSVYMGNLSDAQTFEKVSDAIRHADMMEAEGFTVDMRRLAFTGQEVA